MCLIAFAWRAHPAYELVLIANRDEFHHRPTAAAAAWPDHPQVFGGRDLLQQGSWLALAQGTRLAAVTNVRRMVPPDPSAPSRGALVADFVQGQLTAEAYAQRLLPQAEAYHGFNLLLCDGAQMIYVTNHPAGRVEILRPGVHAVSNASLDTPWPKLRRVRDGLSTWVAREHRDSGELFALLGDTQPAPEAELPDTGVGPEMERFLSPPFIRSASYGTRSSTVLAISTQGGTRFHEKRYGPDGQPSGETLEQLPPPHATA